MAYSMQTRPCLSSASRSHLMSRKSEKRVKPSLRAQGPDDWLAGAVKNGIAFDGLAIAILTDPLRRVACTQVAALSVPQLEFAGSITLGVHAIEAPGGGDSAAAVESTVGRFAAWAG